MSHNYSLFFSHMILLLYRLQNVNYKKKNCCFLHNKNVRILKKNKRAF